MPPAITKRPPIQIPATENDIIDKSTETISPKFTEIGNLINENYLSEILIVIHHLIKYDSRICYFYLQTNKFYTQLIMIFQI